MKINGNFFLIDNRLAKNKIINIFSKFKSNKWLRATKQLPKATGSSLRATKRMLRVTGCSLTAQTVTAIR
ncbi:hypothetical protein GCM10011384_02340 [Psychrobacillus lasiicapitis]|nr:hypothetical protein GCM10011384_02340 [Psychrobacillus lasiicapitis]